MDLTVLVKQLENALSEYEKIVQQSKHADLSDLSARVRQAAVSKLSVAIRMASGTGSPYVTELEQVLQRDRPLHAHAGPVAGLAQALLDDIKGGYTRSVVELVHADLFADFVEMAEHLLATGYKDAAAVIVGSTLEAHLRALCVLHCVDTFVLQPDGSKPPKKADQMNSDLARVGVYSKLDQKSVTAWLDLRNKAAHGQYAQYAAQQVQLLCSSVRDFIGRLPA